MADGSVLLAYVHGPQVAHSWHSSLVGLLAHDAGHERRVSRGGVLATRCKTDGLAEARNAAVAQFLDSDVEWLMWVDTDMGFDPDSVDRLLAVADRTERPIVGGLCFRLWESEPDGMGGWRTAPQPTLFRWAEVDGQQGYKIDLAYAEGLVEVDATGSAFVLIHRDVLAKVGDAYGPYWYTRMPVPSAGVLLGEDLSFCRRATSLGFPVVVDTRVKTTHMKTVWVGEADNV